MNRQQRHAEAAKARDAAKVRHDAVRNALAYMAARNDPTISSATLFLPTGEVLHLSAGTAQARPKREGLH